MKTVEVAAAIIQRDGRVLATQRGYGELAGGWEFPGGKLEQGEDPEHAVVREVREEMGATIAVDSLLAVIDYEYDTFHLHMHCFLVHVESGVLELREHSDARWLDATTIESVDWLPADIQIVELLKREGVVI